jgi:glycosyltransferase involved in cell wall biosynthesis
MRILYFSRDYSTHDHRFLVALIKTGHAISYLRLERGGHLLEERDLPVGIEPIAWRGGETPARLADGPGLLADLGRVLRESKPDLVLAGPIQRAAFLVALAGFHPLVSMSWGYDLLLDARRSIIWKWATRFTLRRSAAFVGDCATIRRLAESYGMPPERIVTFPWGIDLKHFSPAPRQGSEAGIPASTPFTLLSTRSWEPLYGVDLIAQAFVKAAAQRPELHLVMLNHGSQAPLLHEIFSQNGLSDADKGGKSRVTFPGQIGYAELPGFYRATDLYVAATHSDGTSISLLEAMACGCPVLVSDIPGNLEWVKQDRNGWSFRDGDADALTGAILQAVESRSQLPEMGRAARMTAEERADWSKNFPQLALAFEIATGQPAGSLNFSI